MRQYVIHVVLFVTTFFTTLFAGALQKGINPFKEPSRIWEGLPFCVSLMAILLAHELSHYFASKKNHTKATLPYFIPAPSIIGTFGAFIKMKSPIISRKALIDIGASGPIGGFIVAVAVTVYGLSRSEIVELSPSDSGIVLGDSMIFKILSQLILGTPPEGKDILLHPVAFSGWIGMFITSMNLLPIGQLDGGHIAYALFGRRNHRRLSYALTIILAIAGLSRLYLYSDLFSAGVFEVLKGYLWEGWAVWALLLYMLGLEHPPIIYWEEPLQQSRKIIGWIALAIFLLTFTPVPFKIL